MINKLDPGWPDLASWASISPNPYQLAGRTENFVVYYDRGMGSTLGGLLSRAIIDKCEIDYAAVRRGLVGFNREGARTRFTLTVAASVRSTRIVNLREFTWPRSVALARTSLACCWSRRLLRHSWRPKLGVGIVRGALARGCPGCLRANSILLISSLMELRNTGWTAGGPTGFPGLRARIETQSPLAVRLCI